MGDSEFPGAGRSGQLGLLYAGRNREWRRGIHKESCAHDKDTDSANDEVGPCTRPHGAEQYDQQHLSGETGVLIEKRFTVETKEAGVSMEGLKALLGKGKAMGSGMSIDSLSVDSPPWLASRALIFQAPSLM
jgi:hypothetical protein